MVAMKTDNVLSIACKQTGAPFAVGGRSAAVLRFKNNTVGEAVTTIAKASSATRAVRVRFTESIALEHLPAVAAQAP